MPSKLVNRHARHLWSSQAVFARVPARAAAGQLVQALPAGGGATWAASRAAGQLHALHSKNQSSITECHLLCTACSCGKLCPLCWRKARGRISASMQAPRTPGRPPRGRTLPAPGKPPSPNTGIKSPSKPSEMAPPRAPAASAPRPRGVPPAGGPGQAPRNALLGTTGEASRTPPPQRAGSPVFARPAAAASPRGPRGMLAAAGKSRSHSDLKAQKATPPAAQLSRLGSSASALDVRLHLNVL